MSAAQNVQKPEPPQAKDAFVAAIMAVKAVALAMMDARGRQMSHPPEGQKERQQQAFQMRSLLELCRFDVPAARFGILKGGLHAHAQRIGLDASLPRRQIRNEEPRFLKGLLPTGTDIRLDGLLLPHTCAAIPLLPFGVDEALEGSPATPLFLLAHLPTAGMLLADV